MGTLLFLIDCPVPRALPNFTYLSMFGIENITSVCRRSSVEVRIETELSAMGALPSRWTTYVRDDCAKKEAKGNPMELTEKTSSLLHTSKYETNTKTTTTASRNVFYFARRAKILAMAARNAALRRPPPLSLPKGKPLKVFPPASLATSRSFFM